MAEKAITIYTPSNWAPHIFAEDDAQAFRAVFAGSGITDADNRLAATVVSNNSVRLDSGLYSNMGYLLSIPAGKNHALTIGSGTAGMYRRDLIVAEFRRGGGATADTHEFKVVAGNQSPNIGSASRPSLTQNNIATGGMLRQEALYEVLLNGTAISSVTRIANYVGGFYA